MRKALLVGINRYRTPGNNLAGCVNDVLDVRKLLKDGYGWKNKEIRLLVDERATKARIMNRLTWLIAGAHAGDTLLFHYSGHGSQVLDRNGDELNDHMDEILCPHDVDWDGTYITDDEIQSVLLKVPLGVTVVILFDSCYSGTATRAFVPPPHLGGPTHQPRLLVPPVDVLARVEGDTLSSHRFRDAVNVSREPTAKGISPDNKRHISFWAGCMEDQTSADAYFGTRPNGAFTYAFLKALKADQTQPKTKLLATLRAFLKGEGYDQVPQLEIQDGEGYEDGAFLT